VEDLVFRPAVYGIVRNDGRILLVNNRRTGKLYLPGGGVELGERLQVALKREVKEETGVDIAVGAFLGFKETFFYYDPLDEAFHSLLFFYDCTPLTYELLPNELIADEEAENPRWVDTHSLEAGEFQNHGETIIEILENTEWD